MSIFLTVLRSDSLSWKALHNFVWAHAVRPHKSKGFRHRYEGFSHQVVESLLESYGIAIEDVGESATDEGDRIITVNETEYMIRPDSINAAGVNNLIRRNSIATRFLMITNMIVSEIDFEKRVYSGSHSGEVRGAGVSPP